jgi:hypothetical protein
MSGQEQTIIRGLQRAGGSSGHRPLVGPGTAGAYNAPALFRSSKFVNRASQAAGHFPTDRNQLPAVY